MQELQLRDVKATLSSVVDQVEEGEQVIITKHGRRAAVILSWDEYQRITKPIPSFGWLLSHAPVEDEGDIPARDETPPRAVEL